MARKGNNFKIISISINPDIVERIDHAASVVHLSRSETIQWLVVIGLDQIKAVLKAVEERSV